VPNLACRACGRQIYTTAPLDALFAEERRCPRCGAFLDKDRRTTDRRSMVRRQAAIPPGGELVTERRVAERRTARRRAPQQ
jgi:hypothetical protein